MTTINQPTNIKVVAKDLFIEGIGAVECVITDGNGNYCIANMQALYQPLIFRPQSSFVF